MVRLELTLAETYLLQQSLTDSLSDRSAQREGLQAILSQLTLAADQTTCLLHCPVCQHAFTHKKTGRTGRYCSLACKQKASHAVGAKRHRQSQLASSSLARTNLDVFATATNFVSVSISSRHLLLL